MSAGAAKKLTLALYLDPAASAVDREAMAAMQQWYESKRESCDSRIELDERIRAFHHDVYLAGLRLHLLDPRLCQRIAQTLDQRDLNLAGLARQLTAQGVWPEVGDRGFSAEQVQQLEQILVASSPAPAESPAEQASSEEAASLSRQLSEVQTELHALRALAEEQAQQLRRLSAPSGRKATSKSAARTKVKEDGEVSKLTAQIAQMEKVRAKGVF